MLNEQQNTKISYKISFSGVAKGRVKNKVEERQKRKRIWKKHYFSKVCFSYFTPLPYYLLKGFTDTP